MSNNATKVKNPLKVITGPDTRWSYANVWEPKSINGGTPKYSVSLIIPKSDTKTVAKIKAAIEAAYQEGQAKLKGNGRAVYQSLIKIRGANSHVGLQDLLATGNGNTGCRGSGSGWERGPSWTNTNRRRQPGGRPGRRRRARPGGQPSK